MLTQMDTGKSVNWLEQAFHSIHGPGCTGFILSSPAKPACLGLEAQIYILKNNFILTFG